MKETEKAIDAEIVKRVKAMGGMAIKLTSAHYTGLPDRLILLPEGRIWFIEVKSKGVKPTKRQLLVHSLIRQLGFDVYVVDSEESLVEALNF